MPGKRFFHSEGTLLVTMSYHSLTSSFLLTHDGGLAANFGVSLFRGEPASLTGLPSLPVTVWMPFASVETLGTEVLTSSGFLLPPQKDFLGAASAFGSGLATGAGSP